MAVIFAGCAAEPTAHSPTTTALASAISDAAHSAGTAGFYFLPPMVSSPAATGAFDADIAVMDPTVAICDLNLGEAIDCGGSTPAAVTFSSSTSPAISVDPLTGQYQVNWNTKAAGFEAGHTYRLHVVAGAVGARRELGFANVLLTANPGQVKSVATGEVIVLNDGQTLPIKFRIETSIAGSVTVTIDPSTVRTNETATASALVLSLHGQPLAGVGLTWNSGGVPVSLASTATTDADGVGAVAVLAGNMPGVATVSVGANGLSADAELTVVPAVIDQSTVLASMNDPRYGMAVVSSGGLLFAIGGWSDQTGVTNRNESYDPATNVWTIRTPAPTKRWHAAGAVVNGIVYVMGGAPALGCCNAASTIEAYDPATDTWTTKAPMPFPREQFAVAVHNGLIFAIGGWGPGFISSVAAYDPATNSWTPKASMPAGRSGHAVAVVNGRFYVIGGENVTLFTAPVLEYDPGSNSWATKASIPSPRVMLGAAAVGGVVYAIGGNNGAVFNIDAYNPSTDSWSVKSPLNINRFDLGVVAINGVVYAVGGVGGVRGILAVAQLEGYRP